MSAAPGRRLAVVVAHPDDDTFGCSGTVALHAEDPGLRFTLVHVTSGEQGEIADPALATRETLGAVREEEDRRSWLALGRAPDRHEFFRLPDGGVADVAFEDLVERIGAVLREEHPDVVITFGPDGITGHPDHITVGRAATEAFHRARETSPDGFRRLLHQAISASSMLAFNEVLVSLGRDPIDIEHPEVYEPRGVPDAAIGVSVDCGPVADRKLAALLEHRSQANEVQSFPEELLRQILEREAHVMAWPPRAVGAPPLADVFDDLG